MPPLNLLPGSCPPARGDAGLAIIIEHDMFVIEGVSGRVAAFNDARTIAEGSFAAVPADPQVCEADLGPETTRA